jgi:diguanylate cyclase (GGDEF)-like protein
LVASDQEWSARSIASILMPQGFAVILEADAASAIEQALRAKPDLILLDRDLPDRSGIEVCRTLRSNPRLTAATPIILTSARAASRKQRHEALAAGAWDFMALPLDPEEFLFKADLYVRAKLSADQASEASLIDPESDFYNVRGLIRRLREMLAEARRFKRPVACIIFSPLISPREERVSADGHVARSAVLGEFTQVLSGGCRASDVLGRIRTTEFALAAPATDSEGALELAKRLQRTAEHASRDQRGRPSLSLRAGYYAETDFRNGVRVPEELLSRATGALRLAQENPATPILGADAAGN